MSELIPQAPSGYRFQNAYSPLAMAAQNGETAVVEATALEPIEIGDELTWNIHIPQFSGDTIRLRHNNTDLGYEIAAAGRYQHTHLATHTSPLLRIVSGSNPGGGARHVVGEWSVTKPD